MLAVTVSIADRIKARAAALGFDLVGIASAEPSKYRQHLLDWLEQGQAGEMHYLRERFAERVDPNLYLPGVKSVVCVALNYHVPLEPAPSGTARIARYAQGDDYHDRLKDMLYDLADWIRAEFPGTQTRCGTDSAPIMERELAARAGVGWVGKNTMVIHPKVGSWILLGEVLTTLEIEPDSPLPDHCGTCTRCIDACPTAAIVEPYKVDATRCISYLTIEHRHDLPTDLSAKMGDWMFGCDICQDVCPHNHRAPTTETPWLQPRRADNAVDAAAVAKWSLDEYHAFTRHSAMRRVKLPLLQRNAAAVVANAAAKKSGDPR